MCTERASQLGAGGLTSCKVRSYYPAGVYIPDSAVFIIENKNVGKDWVTTNPPQTIDIHTAAIKYLRLSAKKKNLQVKNWFLPCFSL